MARTLRELIVGQEWDARLGAAWAADTASRAVGFRADSGVGIFAAQRQAKAWPGTERS
jgi:hypothetical protein